MIIKNVLYIITTEHLMKKFILVSLILITIPLSLFAARRFEGYESGNYKISIRIPFELPVGYWVRNGFGQNENTHWAGWGDIGYKNNLEFALEIDYDHFMNNYLSLGGRLGYHFAYARNDKIISRVPFLFNVGFYPFQTSNLEIPIKLGIGGAYLNSRGYSMATMYLSVETGLSFYWNDNWGIGVRSGVHMVPEFKSGSNSNASVTFFVPIALELTFRR